MDQDAVQRLVRFFGRERFGRLFLKAWHLLVDGLARRLGLPDYVSERILDHALTEFDSSLDRFRAAIDARPSVFLFALGWRHTREMLRVRTADRNEPFQDLDFWEGLLARLDEADDSSVHESLVRALDELPDGKHRTLLRLDAVAEGPANRQIVSEATDTPLLRVEQLRDKARTALRASVELRLPEASEWAGGSEPRPARSIEIDFEDPLSIALNEALVEVGEIPPHEEEEGGDELLYAWLQQFGTSRSELAITALWKRLPPAEVVREAKPQPGPLVALADSLFQRIEKLERRLEDRLDDVENRIMGTPPEADTDTVTDTDTGERPADVTAEPDRTPGNVKPPSQDDAPDGRSPGDPNELPGGPGHDPGVGSPAGITEPAPPEDPSPDPQPRGRTAKRRKDRKKRAREKASAQSEATYTLEPPELPQDSDFADELSDTASPEAPEPQHEAHGIWVPEIPPESERSFDRAPSPDADLAPDTATGGVTPGADPVGSSPPPTAPDEATTFVENGPGSGDEADRDTPAVPDALAGDGHDGDAQEGEGHGEDGNGGSGPGQPDTPPGPRSAHSAGISGWLRSLMETGRAKTHGEVVDRLERYLPAHRAAAERARRARAAREAEESGENPPSEEPDAPHPSDDA